MEFNELEKEEIVTVYQPMVAEDGKMSLWNGEEIDAFPKGDGYEAPEPASPESFITNAFFLLANHEKILSDSRMFLSPIGIQSGLAYTGTSFFREPTLGVYIEWWLNFGGCSEVMENSVPHLVYHIAGSALTGGNRCSMVSAEGESKGVFVANFSLAWSSFARINSRYTEAKRKYEAMPLEEVLVALNADPDRKPKELVANKMLVREMCRLNEEVDGLQKFNRLLQEDLETAHALMSYDKVAPLYIEMLEEMGVIESELEECRSMHRRKKELLHRGEITQKMAQMEITAILAKKESLNNQKEHILHKYAEQIKRIDSMISLRGLRRAYEQREGKNEK